LNLRRYLIAGIIATSGCSATVSSSVGALFESHKAYDEASISWIRGDLQLLKSTCSRLTPSIKSDLLKQLAHWNAIVASNPVDDNVKHQQDALARQTSFGSHIKICSELAAGEDSLKAYERAATLADNTADYDTIDSHLEKLRSDVDLEINEFPDSGISVTNFQLADREAFFTEHQEAAAKAGEAVAKAVDAAREASGKAAKATISAEHESDRELAKASDAAYGEARNALSSLSGTTESDKLFAGFAKIISSVDTAVANANVAINGGAANPVSKITETLPTVAFQSLSATPAPISTDTPTPNTAIAPNYSRHSVSESDGVRLVRGTDKFQLVGMGNSGCANHEYLIRFKDDGNSGCASIENGLRDRLESGADIVLIPVFSAQHIFKYDLMYSVESGSDVFVGILPGNGGTEITISIEDGYVVDRSSPNPKRSTYRNGKVVPA